MISKNRIINCHACGQKLRAPADKEGFCKCPTCGQSTFIDKFAVVAKDEKQKKTNSYTQNPIKTPSETLKETSKKTTTATSRKTSTRTEGSNPWYYYRAAGFILIISMILYQALNNRDEHDRNFENQTSAFKQLVTSPNIVNEFTLPRASGDMCKDIEFNQVLTVDESIHKFKTYGKQLLDDAFTKTPKAFDVDSFKPQNGVFIFSLLLLILGIIVLTFKIGVKHKDIILFYPALLIAVIAGSWGWSAHMINTVPAHDLAYYTDVLKPTEKIYSLLSPWAYSETPYKQFNDEYVRSAISYYISKGNMSPARAFADIRINEYTGSAVQVVNYVIAIEDYKGGDIVSAARSIYLASLIEGQQNYIEPALSGLLNEYAVKLANQGEFNSSLAVKSQINHAYSIDELDAKIWMDLYQTDLQFQTQDAPRNIETLLQISKTIRKYLDLSSIASPSIQRFFMCELSEVHLFIAQEELIAENPDRAIVHIEHSKKLVDAEETTNILYASAMDLKGIKAFNAGDIDGSISFLSSALNNDVDNFDLACRLSLATATKGQHQAFEGKFDGIKKLFEEAISLCSSETISEMWLDVLVINAQWHLRGGELEIAQEILKQVAEDKHPSTSKVAKSLLFDSYQAKSRKRKLAEVSRWAEEIPRITGTLCDINPDTGNCEQIILYDMDREIGRAELDFSYVMIKDFKKTIYLADTLKDGRFDSYELTTKTSSRRLYEKDGDYLLDREVVLSSNGGVLKDEIYSGQLFLKFPNGAVKDSCDFWSSCDTYLIVKQNNKLIGNTEVDEDTQFPSWYTGTAINFKKGDFLYIKMMDSDAGLYNAAVNDLNSIFGSDFNRDRDDFIDDFKFTKLPQSNKYIGRNGKATLQLIVSPTNAPPGMYKWDNSENVNIFRHYTTGDFEDDVLDSIVKGAHKTEEYHEFTSMAGSYVLPEVALYSLYGHGKFVQQLILGLAASEVTHDVLKNKGG
jgi:uncharacterized Zn finger protein (UPF0148 family)